MWHWPHKQRLLWWEERDFLLLFFWKKCVFFVFFTQRFSLWCLLLSSRCHNQALTPECLSCLLSHTPTPDQLPALGSHGPHCSLRLFPHVVRQGFPLQLPFRPEIYYVGLLILPRCPCFDFVCILYAYFLKKKWVESCGFKSSDVVLFDGGVSGSGVISLMLFDLTPMYPPQLDLILSYALCDWRAAFSTLCSTSRWRFYMFEMILD